MPGTESNSETTILTVGDGARVKSSLAQDMAPGAYRFLYADSGELALDILALNTVDLVLLDSTLPDGDGLDVCRQIRETQGIAELPVLMLSTQADAAARIAAYDGGADSLLAMPMDAAELRARVRSVIRLNRYRRMHEQANRLQESEEQLAELREYDQGTGLPNALAFHAALEVELERAARAEYPLAVVMVDLSDYDDLIGVYGKAEVEVLARRVADRLAATVRGRAIVGRHDSRCFAVCQPLPRADELTSAVHRFRRALSDTWPVRGDQLKLSTSVGASIFPSDGDNAERLVALAVSAMSHARQSGRNRYHVFAPAARAEARRRLRLETRISQAVEQDRIELYYQPRLRLNTGEVTGVEALMRLRDDNDGFVSPQVFIPIAEDAGLMDDLGRWALQRACRDAAMLRGEGHDLRMSVNIAGDLFSHDNFLDDVRTALARHGLDGSALELEITESALRPRAGDSILSLRQLLDSIKAEGISLAVDNFGTGFSCLDNLRHLPLDAIKIDREFVKEIDTEQRAGAIVQSIITLGRNLAMNIVAEGVETGQQVRFLKEAGCEEAQGFLFARPVSLERLGEVLHNLREDWAESAGPATQPVEA